MKRHYNLKINRLPKEKLVFHPCLSTQSVPDSIDLRTNPNMPAVYDQGNIGSCTANALCAAYDFVKPGEFMGSRLFLYYNERVLGNDVSTDAGASLGDGIKCLQTHGLCRENLWPYDISQFATKPPDNCYTEALADKALKVYNVPNTFNEMQATLASGLPFVAGIKVFSSFESASVSKNGIVSMPKPKDKLLGGHAVLVCGYNNKTNQWILRNSWGSKWGDNGYFYLPYKYLLKPKLSSDFWAIEAVS
jgi:C1A family cysteine protease